jgi:hypothetical protein
MPNYSKNDGQFQDGTYDKGWATLNRSTPSRGAVGGFKIRQIANSQNLSEGIRQGVVDTSGLKPKRIRQAFGRE